MALIRKFAPIWSSPHRILHVQGVSFIVQQISNARLYIIHSDRVSNPILHRQWSTNSLSEGDSNPDENEREGPEEVLERATARRSGRVRKSNQNADFKYDLHVISSAPPT